MKHIFIVLLFSAFSLGAQIHNTTGEMPISYSDNNCSFIGWTPAHIDSVIQPKPDRWKWNNAKYFQRLEYKMKPDKKFLDWSNFNETWDGKQVVLWALYALAGVAHGMGEAFHADPYVYEKRWNVGESSFFGSDSWERNYIGNNPANRHKQQWLGNFGRDIWHTQNHIDFFGTGIATYAISGRSHPKKYRIANFLAGAGIRSLFATVTYQTLRR